MVRTCRGLWDGKYYFDIGVGKRSLKKGRFKQDRKPLLNERWFLKTALALHRKS
jgi:hypothetical protein